MIPIPGPIRGVLLQRINTAYFYRLASKLLPLSMVEQGKAIADVYPALYGAEEELRFFLSNDLLPPTSSLQSGNHLHTVVFALGNDIGRDSPEITWTEAANLRESLARFDVALQADFGIRDTFIVSPKRVYSTTLLINYGESLVSGSALKLVPQITVDMHDAGRCVAFELPTAAAFHLFRAVEAVVHAYGVFVRGKSFSEKEKKGGIGSYSNCLKERALGVDLRITGAIDQLSSLYRNPTMHPERHVSNDEVIGVLNLSVSVIDIVALDWNRRKETPNVSLVDLIPDDTTIAGSLEADTEKAADDGQTNIRSSNEENTQRFKAGARKTHRSRVEKDKSGTRGPKPRASRVPASS